MNAMTKTVTQTDSNLIEVLRNSFYPEASPDSIQLVLGYCRAAGLDPMKKPVHIVPMYNRKAGMMVYTIMPGIGLYRIEASRTGDYIGKGEPVFGPDVTRKLGGIEVTFPSWCKITVQRLVHGRECSYTASEFWMENYATAKKDTDAPNTMWKKRPYGQLAKCAESQALRMAFPEQTGGTNTAEEMDGKTFDGMTLEHAPAPAAEPQEPIVQPLTMLEKVARRLDTCTTLAQVQTVEDLASVQKALTEAPDDVVRYLHTILAAARHRIEPATADALDEDTDEAMPD